MCNSAFAGLTRSQASSRYGKSAKRRAGIGAAQDRPCLPAARFGVHVERVAEHDAALRRQPRRCRGIVALCQLGDENEAIDRFRQASLSLHHCTQRWSTSWCIQTTRGLLSVLSSPGWFTFKLMRSSSAPIRSLRPATISSVPAEGVSGLHVDVGLTIGKPEL